MKRYQNPELYERLSAEYVLGTLKGRALKRFERLLAERPYIRYAVDLWEQRFGETIDWLPEEKPPAAVWQAIQKEIHGQTSVVGQRAEKGWLARLFGATTTWQAVSAGLAAALMVVLFKPAPGGDKMPMPSYVAVLESDHDTPMMVTLGDQKKRMVSVRVVKMPKLPPNRDLQLWAVRDPKTPPVPVGVLRHGDVETQLKLSPPQWQRIEGAKIFAISFEPKGGSPTGKPTGKIMYKGECLDFI